MVDISLSGSEEGSGWVTAPGYSTTDRGANRIGRKGLIYHFNHISPSTENMASVTARTLFRFGELVRGGVQHSVHAQPWVLLDQHLCHYEFQTAGAEAIDVPMLAASVAGSVENGLRDHTRILIG